MARSQSRCDPRYKAVASCADAPPGPRARPRRRRAARGLRIGLERRRRRATTTNATASTNDDTGGSRPAEGRAAAGRGVRLVKVGDFQAPLYVTAPPGDKRRLFVVEQAGRIVVVRGGKPLAQPFLDIRSKVTAGGEQGLLSMAFAPDYAQSGLFYVYYTEKSGTEAIWEYHRASDDRADPDSARLVLRMDDPEPNHNGGLMIFGPDKLMYVGTGDGGGGNDQHGTARQRAVRSSSPLGKILRIDPQAVGRRAVHDPVLEPVRRARGRARRDLLLRAAQPVALLVRQRHRRPRHRRRRAGRRSRRSTSSRRAAGAARTSAGARGRAAGATSTSRRRTRSSPSSPTPTRPASARSRAASSRATAACPALYGRYVYGDYCNGRLRVATLRAGQRAQSRTLVGAARLGRLVVRRGRLGRALRGLAQRAGLPLRGALTGVDRRHAGMIPRVSGRPSVDSVARRADPERVERLFDLVEQAIRAKAPAPGRRAGGHAARAPRAPGGRTCSTASTRCCPAPARSGTRRGPPPTSRP